MKKTRLMVECSILLAVEVLLLTVPFFQIELGAFTIVFTALPVAVAAVIIGVSGAALLGCVWGLISFLQAFGDSFGVIMLNSNLVGTILVLGISRIMVAMLTAWFYSLTGKFIGKLGTIRVTLTCVLASVLNNLFFMSGLALFFHDAYMEFINPILQISIIFNMLPETIVCGLVGPFVVVAIYKSRNI